MRNKSESVPSTFMVLEKYGEYQHNLDFFQNCFLLIEESQETKLVLKIHKNKVTMQTYILIKIKCIILISKPCFSAI